jgi:hypothetical protein
MTRERLIAALSDISGLPVGAKRRRMVYESAGRRHFHVDYASFPGGTTEEVPKSLIDELERDGILVRAYPGCPEIAAWILGEQKEQG